MAKVHLSIGPVRLEVTISREPLERPRWLDAMGKRFPFLASLSAGLPAEIKDWLKPSFEPATAAPPASPAPPAPDSMPSVERPAPASIPAYPALRPDVAKAYANDPRRAQVGPPDGDDLLARKEAQLASPASPHRILVCLDGEPFGRLELLRTRRHVGPEMREAMILRVLNNYVRKPAPFLHLLGSPVPGAPRRPYAQVSLQPALKQRLEIVASGPGCGCSLEQLIEGAILLELHHAPELRPVKVVFLDSMNRQTFGPLGGPPQPIVYTPPSGSRSGSR